MRKIEEVRNEIIKRLEKINVGPEELEWRWRLFGDENVWIIVTLEHYNISVPSRVLVGWWRLKFILEAILDKQAKAFWIVLDDPETIKNEAKRCGGGENIDFGPFGKYMPHSLNEENEKLMMSCIDRFLNSFCKFNKTEKRIIYHSLMGRMRGILSIYNSVWAEVTGEESRIKFVRLSSWLDKIEKDIPAFRRERWDWVVKAGVIHFGNTYLSDPEILALPNFLPDGCNSQPIGVWKWGNRLYDTSPLHLLYFQIEEYRKKIVERANEFVASPPIFEWEELVRKFV